MPWINQRQTQSAVSQTHTRTVRSTLDLKATAGRQFNQMELSHPLAAGRTTQIIGEKGVWVAAGQEHVASSETVAAADARSMGQQLRPGGGGDGARWFMARTRVGLLQECCEFINLKTSHVCTRLYFGAQIAQWQRIRERRLRVPPRGWNGVT